MPRQPGTRLPPPPPGWHDHGCVRLPHTRALTGDRRTVLKLLGQARDHLDAAQGREEWMYDFDHSALAGYRGESHLRVDSHTRPLPHSEKGWHHCRPAASDAAHCWRSGWRKHACQSLNLMSACTMQPAH